MDIAAIASSVSTNAAVTLRTQASLLVLKKAMELQQANAAQLLQVLPRTTGPTPGARLGGAIDTFA